MHLKYFPLVETAGEIEKEKIVDRKTEKLIEWDIERDKERTNKDKLERNGM